MIKNINYLNEHYVLYNGIIYKILKIINKTAKIIIIDIETLLIYSITWELYGNLKWFRNLEEVEEAKNIHSNFFNINNLKYNYNSDDIFNFNFNENPRLITPNKTNLKYYSRQGLNAKTFYKVEPLINRC
jgi:hypothetical protein